MKKIIATIATIIIFVIGGYYYLSAPEDEAGGADTQATTEATDTVVNDGKTAAATEATETAVNDAKPAATTEATVVDYEDAVTENEEQEYQVTYEFRKQQDLDEHFEKHGSEFDYANADEYLAGANRVINDPNSLYKTEAEDGDHIYYLESTNEFVVVSTDGYIRTYFKPSAGIDYFNRQ